MALNLSALPDFKTEGRGFVIKSILEAQTIKILNDGGAFDPKAKGSNTVQLLGNDVTIQDGTSCGFSPIGGAVLSQAVLNVKAMKINEEYCERDYTRVWVKGEQKAGLDYTDLTFMGDIAEVSTASASLQLEQKIWTSTGGTMVGFIPQIKAGAFINLSGATGTTTIKKLQAIFKAMPIAVTDSPDFRLWIGKDTYNDMVAELAEKNLFNPTTEKTLFGTTAQLEVVSGLNGGHVVASRIRNLQAGGEMTDITFDSWYSKDDDVIKVAARFSLGVVPVYPEEIGYVKLAA